MAFKHIVISAKNYEKLRSMGKTSDSFNDVLDKLLKDKGDSKNVST